MTHEVPNANFNQVIKIIIGMAQPGDTIQVPSEAKAQLARRAMERQGVKDLKVTVSGEKARRGK